MEHIEAGNSLERGNVHLFLYQVSSCNFPKLPLLQVLLQGLLTKENLRLLLKFYHILTMMFSPRLALGL